MKRKSVDGSNREEISDGGKGKRMQVWWREGVAKARPSCLEHSRAIAGWDGWLGDGGERGLHFSGID